MTAFGIFRMTTWLLRTRVGVLRAAARGEDVPVSIVAHKWDLLGTGEFRIVSSALTNGRIEEPVCADPPVPAATPAQTNQPR
jgi:hypothetical protein